MPDDERLRLLVASQPDYAMFVLDPDGRIATWNLGAQRLKGYAPDEIVGRHFSVFYTEEARAREHPQEELRIAAATGRYEEEGWRIRSDGTQFWAHVQITALRDEAGELVGFGKVTRPADDRLLVESVRDYAIFMLDAGGHVRSWNAGARALKGYAPAEIVGRHFATFYTDEDRADGVPGSVLAAAVDSGRCEAEGWRVRKDGTRFWANVVLTALRDGHGSLVGFTKVTRDLTERHEAEERLRASAAELERFAAGAAHDLSSPLHTIGGFAQLVEHRYGERLGEDGVRFLREITAGTERMRRLIEGLLRYARTTQQGLDVRPVSLAGVMTEVASNVAGAAEGAGATVVYDPAALPEVAGDETMLLSVMQNLVDNGLKFGASRVEVTATREGDRVRVDVTDDGMGIAEDDRERIFAMFGRAEASAEQAGVGLGLALCRRLVTRLGGEIGVESEVDAGSRFWFTLPAAG